MEKIKKETSIKQQTEIKAKDYYKLVAQQINNAMRRKWIFYESVNFIENFTGKYIDFLNQCSPNT